MWKVENGLKVIMFNGSEYRYIDFKHFWFVLERFTFENIERSMKNALNFLARKMFLFK